MGNIFDERGILQDHLFPAGDLDIGRGRVILGTERNPSDSLRLLISIDPSHLDSKDDDTATIASRRIGPCRSPYFAEASPKVILANSVKLLLEGAFG